MYLLGTKKLWKPEAVKQGRNIAIVIGTETHEGVFALVELDEITASHNEENFSPSEGYPTTPKGHNINDRNYQNDKAAQSQVAEYARLLSPELLITTSRAASGTPIITVDGFVVSGNNRTMSLKLAAKQYPDRYDAYKHFLQEELAAFGLNTQDLAGFKKPVLVRIDFDFAEYTTEQMAKYNQTTQKGKRPIDKAVELGEILSSNTLCSLRIPETFAPFGTMSEFYANVRAQRELMDKLLQCGIINQAEKPTFYTPETGFSAVGKDLIETILLSLILDREILNISIQDGIKSHRQKLITSITLLIKNKTFPKDYSIIPYVNEAMRIAYDARISDPNNRWGFKTFLGNSGQLFDAQPYSRYGLAIYRILDGMGLQDFKKSLAAYNEGVEAELAGNSFLFESPSPTERLDRFFNVLPQDEQKLIEAYTAGNLNAPTRKPSFLDWTARKLESLYLNIFIHAPNFVPNEILKKYDKVKYNVDNLFLCTKLKPNKNNHFYIYYKPPVGDAIEVPDENNEFSEYSFANYPDLYAKVEETSNGIRWVTNLYEDSLIRMKEINSLNLLHPKSK